MEDIKRIVLAEDQTILREGLRRILSDMHEVEVVGEAKDGLELTQRVQEWEPDLVLLDLTMPNMNGIDAIGEIKRKCPSTKIMVLTIHDSEEFIQAAFEAGAEGYCLKESTRSELIEAIKRVLSGHRYISAGITKGVLEGYLKDHEPRRPTSRWDQLSKRERQILKMVAEGNKSSEIAKDLCISPRTVEKHRTNIMAKLGIHNVAELTAYAIEKGLVAK
jgi:DNA-binding NarL/FixJ family response regulator